MGDCDECRRGLLRAGLSGVAVLLVPGCGNRPDDSGSGDGGGGPDEAGGDDASGDDGGDGGACQPTCASGTETLEFTFVKYPQLENVGGSVTYRATGYSDPSCHLDLIIIVQPTAGTYVAFSAGCPHACCTVAYDAKHTEFLCPCHGSSFNMSGQVTGGPAPNGLQKLTVCVDECAVYVSLP
jgi:Rieske Fe-S protein